MPGSSESRPDPNLRGGLWPFFAMLALLLALRILIGFVSLPLSVLPVVNLLVSAIFLGLPILAIFFAANHPWTWRTASAFLVGGLAVQAVAVIVDRQMFGGKGALSGVVNAVGQAGLSTWCVGLGALLTTLLKEKNILVPIAIFLAIFDAFLILTPVGFTQKIMQAAPQALPTVGMQVPAVVAEPTTGRAAVGAFVGPADLVFLGTFFVALFRFRLRTRETLRLMLPVLFVYLVVVLVAGWNLPALIPIGLVLLVCNWREFKLSRDEWLSTAVIAAMGLALLGWGITRPRPAPPAAPSPTASGPAAPAPAATPGPAPTGPPP